MIRISEMRVEGVEFMPAELADGVLYVSERFKTAAHRCCCGCGTKTVTPLKPGGWNLSGTSSAPTLRPSIGNWNLPCRSHYLITNGGVHEALQWSEAEIEAGRARDHALRQQHFDKKPILVRIWLASVSFIKSLRFW
ncbi:DUF6527 family protein [Parerythrobacter aestuarii]|uniref:DUF6527 family protein n=1 Tax=Parerythrobacter aestuarii TaxID=3020909 RepID=UPI00389AEC85